MRSGSTASNATGDLRPPGYARRRAAAAAVVVLSLALTGAGEVVGAPNAVVGQIRTTKGQVTVARGIPVTTKAELHNGDLVVIGPTGEAELKINVKAMICTAGRNTQLRVAPSENLAFQVLGEDGDLTCATASRSHRAVKVEGPPGSFGIALVDPVFKISVRGRWTTVKVDRGSLVLTGRGGRRRGVVLARKQQSVVPKGGDPRAPQRIALSLRERAVVASLERTLPPLTDTTAPTTTILGRPETLTRNTTAAFTFRASEAGVTFSCALDGVDFRLCSNPQLLVALSVGRHEFSVRATDTAGNTGSTAIYSWRITGTSYRQIIARDAKDVTLEVDARSRARVTYRVDGRAQSVLAWGAINAVPANEGGAQERFILLYGAPPIQNVCRPYTGPPLAWLVTACTAPDGTHWALQQWQRGLPVFGDPPASPEAAGYELHLSHWSGPLAVLEIKVDWAYRKYDHLYGRLTYRGKPVYGFASTSAGNPLDIFGRNIYIDTYDSAYGPGWKREMGLLTHRPTGAFCYGFYTHGQHPTGNGTQYRATVVGPGVTPDILWEGVAPGPYDPVRDSAANDEQRKLLSGDKSCKIS